MPDACTGHGKLPVLNQTVTLPFDGTMYITDVRFEVCTVNPSWIYRKAMPTRMKQDLKQGLRPIIQDPISSFPENTGSRKKNRSASDLHNNYDIL